MYFSHVTLSKTGLKKVGYSTFTVAVGLLLSTLDDGGGRGQMWPTVADDC